MEFFESGKYKLGDPKKLPRIFASMSLLRSTRKSLNKKYVLIMLMMTLCKDGILWALVYVIDTKQRVWLFEVLLSALLTALLLNTLIVLCTFNFSVVGSNRNQGETFSLLL